MKYRLSFLAVLLFPVAAVAAGTDLVLDDNYQQWDFACNVGPTAYSCENQDTFGDPTTKRLHTATISVFAEPGHACEARIEIINVHDGGFNTQPLLRVFATEQSPGSSSITYSSPIQLEARDYFRFVVGNFLPGAIGGGCRGEATLGVERKKN